jgi:SAM-dependent methyltransferase
MTAKHTSDWDFPLVLPRNPVKRAIKVALGRAVLLARPDIGRDIETTGKAKSFVERLAVAGLISRHRSAGSLDRLAHLHANFWASTDAVSFHGLNEDRFNNNFLKTHYVIVNALQSAVAAKGFDTLCEIGCGSGQVIEHLGQKLPSLKKLVGVDLSPAQIALNATRYSDPRLSFTAADGAAWVLEHAAPGLIVLTYGGVYEYFKEDTLRAMFAALRKRAPTCVALVEPIDGAYDLERETASRVLGAELSFSHNYPRLLQEAGFRIRWQQEVKSGFRWLMLVATAGD